MGASAWGWCLGLAGAALGAGCGRATVGPEVVALASTLDVRVLGSMPEYDAERMPDLCSAAVLDSRRLLTAAHCVCSFMGAEPAGSGSRYTTLGGAGVRLSVVDGGGNLAVSSWSWDVQRPPASMSDWVVLRADQMPPAPGRVSASWVVTGRRPAIGERLYLLGYTSAWEWYDRRVVAGVDPRGLVYGVYGLTVIAPPVPSMAGHDAEAFWFRVDAERCHLGWSGGPVFAVDAQGRAELLGVFAGAAYDERGRLMDIGWVARVPAGVGGEAP